MHNFVQRSKTEVNARIKMGIHYDYKSTRGEKALKKEAKRKARIEERRARKGVESSLESKEKKNA